MAFKSLIALAAVALLSIAPVPVANGLSVRDHTGDKLVSRVQHSSLVARQRRGKRCPAFRDGSKPPTSTQRPTSTPPKATSTPTKSTQKPTSTPPKTTNTPPKPTAANYKPGVPVSNFLKRTEQAIGRHVSFTYNWNPRRPDAASGANYIPMLRDRDDESLFVQLTSQSGYAKEALSINEPERGEQGNTSPGQARDIWYRVFVPLKNKGYRVYSPAPASSPAGSQWLEDYFNICGCRGQTDAIAAHYYGNNATYMQNYLTELHNKFDKPLIVTEFGCAHFGGNVYDGCDTEGTYQFVKQITDWMDRQSFILKYAHFGHFTPGDPSGGVPSGNALYNPDGSFTRLGNMYFYR